jgi:hypothetical protein
MLQYKTYTLNTRNCGLGSPLLRIPSLFPCKSLARAAGPHDISVAVASPRLWRSSFLCWSLSFFIESGESNAKGTLHESRCLPAKSSHDSSFSPLFIHLSAFHLGYFAGPVWIGEGRRQSPFTSLAKHRPECMQRITGWSLCVLVLLPCWFPCVLAETACRRRQDGGNPRRRASSDEPRRVAKTSDGSLGWTAGYTRDPTDTVAGRRGPIRVEKVRRF